VQTMFVVGASHDPFEGEADTVARRVLAAPLDHSSGPARLNIHRVPSVVNTQMDSAPASVEQVIAGSGATLQPALREDMGRRFGYDFSGVRIHSGAVAEQSARELDAHAYTVGRNIVFGAGRFTPETPAGRHLIAHELTHVVQQSAAGASGIGATRP